MHWWANWVMYTAVVWVCLWPWVCMAYSPCLAKICLFFSVLYFNYHVIMLSGRQSNAMVIKITKWEINTWRKKTNTKGTTWVNIWSFFFFFIKVSSLAICFLRACGGCMFDGYLISRLDTVSVDSSSRWVTSVGALHMAWPSKRKLPKGKLKRKRKRYNF